MIFRSFPPEAIALQRSYTSKFKKFKIRIELFDSKTLRGQNLKIQDILYKNSKPSSDVF